MNHSIKNFCIKSAILFVSFVLLCANASAAEISYVIDYDYMNHSVTIKGKGDAYTKYAALEVLAAGKTFAEAESNPTDSSLILYRYQEEVRDGEFSFKIGYDDHLTAGAYAAHLAVDNCDDVIEFALQLVNGQTYKSALEKMKSEADKNDYSSFKQFVQDNADELGFNLGLYNELRVANIRPYMHYIAGIQADPGNSTKNAKDFASFVLMAALEENKADNITAYISDTSVGQTQAGKYFTRLADTEEEQKYITEKMSGKKINSMTELENLLKEALMLNEVKYAAGYEGVKKIFHEFGSVIGVDGSASSAVYKGLCGNDYSDGNALSVAYKKLKEQGSIGGGNVGGGNKAGGNKAGGMSSARIDTDGLSQGEMKKPQEFYVPFTDIDGVEWASEAILALSNMGIINGKSENFFGPDDLITREEFAKILVCAMGYENESAGAGLFDDVSENDWFFPYVNIACRKGILKGVGDGRFGAGDAISRQDMTVMICNAFKVADIDMNSAEVLFDDSDSISDYAVEAVGTLYGMGIVNGISDTQFDPLGTATRAQAAKIVYGFCNILNH